MQDAEACSQAWQLQAQAALGQIEHLKDLLAEGIQWVSSDDPNPKTRGGGGAASDLDRAVTTSGGSAGAETQGNRQTCANEDDAAAAKKDALLAEQAAQLAALDVEVRALRAEALRAAQMSSQVGRAVLPALFSIESLLTEQA